MASPSFFVQSKNDTLGGMIERAWIELVIWYTGATESRSILRSEASMILNETCLKSCLFPSSLTSTGIEILVEFQGAPSTIPTSIQTMADAVAVAVPFTGIPSAMVRAGIANSILAMARCDEFDPTEPVDLINNPFGWAVGPEELQYQRGSLVLVFIVLCIVLVMITISLVVVVAMDSSSTSVFIRTMRREDDDDDDEGTETDDLEDENITNQQPSSLLYRTRRALTKLRFPSTPFVVMVFASQMATTSVASMWGYTDSSSRPVSDCILGVAAFLPIYGYMVLYAYESTINIKVHNERKLTKDNTTTFELDRNVINKPPPPPSFIQRCAKYLLEPTHHASPKEPIATPSSSGGVGASGTTSVPLLPPLITDDDGTARHNNNTSIRRENTRWLRRHYYFVAEMRWPAYGPIEVFCGGVTDFMMGIPITTTDRTLCIARPAIALFLLLVCLLLLVLKVPFAVRLQYWTTMLTVLLLIAASAAATANAISPSEETEGFVGYFVGASTAVLIVLSVSDTMTLLALYIPFVRSRLRLQSRSLQTTINRVIAKHKEKRAEEKRALVLWTTNNNTNPTINTTNTNAGRNHQQTQNSTVHLPHGTASASCPVNPTQPTSSPPSQFANPPRRPKPLTLQTPLTNQTLANNDNGVGANNGNLVVDHNNLHSTDDSEEDDLDEEEMRYIDATLKKVAMLAPEIDDSDI